MLPILTAQNVIKVREEPKELPERAFNCLSCSASGKKLVQVIVTDEDVPVSTKIRAKCPYCGDRSFPIKVVGGFSINRTENVIHTGESYLDPDELGLDMNLILTTAKED